MGELSKKFNSSKQHHDSFANNKDRRVGSDNYSKGWSNNYSGGSAFHIPSTGYDPLKMTHGPGKRKK